jgi:hypothetical protein
MNDPAKSATVRNNLTAESVPRASSNESSLALFRAHATARLRGDTTEAARLAAAIGDERRMIHHMFVLALFTEVVISELGDRPDPWDLAELTRTLHDKHHRRDPRFKAIKAEALIRAVCGESFLLTEVAYAQQPAYLWAVMTELVPPDSTDAALAERFRVAEESGAAWRDDALKEPFFAPREQDTAAGAESDSAPRPDPEATQGNRQEPQP